MLKADENKFYHVFSAGKFPYYNWESGKWDTFEILPEYVKSIADCYDASIHKAPVWIGHPWGGAEALAWIAKAKFENGMLYNSFDYIDQELIDAIRNKKYQYVSTEFSRVMGVDNDYQVALGITNLPRVSGQKPLDVEGSQFGKTADAKSIFCPLTTAFSIDLVNDFSGTQKKYFFQNQNKTKMDPNSEKLAKVFSIDLAVCTTDEAVLNQASDKYSKLVSNNSALEAENKTLKEERIASVLEFGMSSGRIQPAKKETFESLLVGNFAAAKKMIDDLPVDPAFSKNSIPTGGAEVKDPSGNTDKFSNADGSKMTYSQFLDKVSEDPDFAGKFSNDELFTLPGASKYLVKNEPKP